MDIATQIIEKAKKVRALAGLKLTFEIPGRPEHFICYPKDEAQKKRWLAHAQTKNWKLI